MKVDGRGDSVRFGAQALLGMVLSVGMVLAVPGCAEIRTGTALRDPGVTAHAVNAALLDTGRYPTAPRSPLAAAGSQEAGAYLEAQRMAEVIVLPMDVDATIDVSDTLRAHPLTSWEQLSGPHQLVAEVSADHNFLAGFQAYWENSARASSRADVTLLRFASPEDAAAAATDMTARTETTEKGWGGKKVPTRTRVPVPPDQLGTTALVIGHDRYDLVYAYTTIGPFVLVTRTEAADRDSALALAFGLADAQRAALDTFTPTPVDQFATLPADPTGLAARVLPPADLHEPVSGVYGTRGALMFMANATQARAWFDQAGVDAVAISTPTPTPSEFVNVYRTRDADAARQLTPELVDARATQDAFGNNQFGSGDRVPGFPTARCLVAQVQKLPFSKDSYYCAGAADRYAIELNAPAASTPISGCRRST